MGRYTSQKYLMKKAKETFKHLQDQNRVICFLPMMECTFIIHLLIFINHEHTYPTPKLPRRYGSRRDTINMFSINDRFAFAGQGEKIWEGMKKYTLPKEFATKWVAALRSGEYQQTQQALYNDGGYCCLGVACLINGANKDEIYGQSYPSNKMLPYVYDENSWTDPELAYAVAELNDKDGKPFPEIADWIEENVEFI